MSCLVVFFDTFNQDPGLAIHASQGVYEVSREGSQPEYLTEDQAREFILEELVHAVVVRGHVQVSQDAHLVSRRHARQKGIFPVDLMDISQGGYFVLMHKDGYEVLGGGYLDLTAALLSVGVEL